MTYNVVAEFIETEEEAADRKFSTAVSEFFAQYGITSSWDMVTGVRGGPGTRSIKLVLSSGATASVEYSVTNPPRKKD